MNGKANQIAKKAKELYARLLQKRYVEITKEGKTRNVWY